ncbi:MAG: PD40 domain-containing protein, partial [Acidobacteria bacterium]|nr:PD40 domain-containing protein [Acidobacteriota bacterium]
MAGADALAAALADAILDGTPIDWSSVESSAGSVDPRLLDQLKLLARVADLHRQLPAWEPDEHWGHLRVLERLGAGAHGTVYRAWDTRLDREVALKLLPAAVDDAAGGSTSIIEEGRLLARVRHPNVVTIYGAEQIADRVGLWMELVAGKTLEQLLEGGRTFTPSEARHIAVELCHAMGAVHGAGLLHRDIKAHNVMLADDGRVVLMDFGTGRELDDRSMSPAAGTPLYLAPEIFAGAPASVRSDVYSAGVLLYRLLTGKYPVGGRTLRALRLAHERGGRSALGLARPDVPTRLCQVVERAIEAYPDSRYQSAEAMARDLALVEPGRWRGVWRYAAGAAAVLLLTVWLVPGLRDHLWLGTNGWASRVDAPVSREIRLEAVPFTSYTGREAEPTFSPDGSLVAFTWDGEHQDNFDIYVKAVGAEHPLRLTSDRARDGSPAWSPDGSRLAFLRDKPGGGSDVCLIPPSGGPERTIAEVQGLAHQGLSWSPDGRSLAVVDRSSPEERLGMFVLDIVSGVKKRLAASTHTDILPAFSPDGRTLAFNRTLLPGGPFVHVVPVAGGEPRVLVPTSVPRGRLAWMPGGDEILFTAVPLTRDGGHPSPSSAGRAGASLWRVPANGGQARLLAGSDNASDVAVSTDGRRLVYSQGTIDRDIWRLDLRRGPTPGDAQTRFIASTKLDANPQFSPDGERVAFTSAR